MALAASEAEVFALSKTQENLDTLKQEVGKMTCFSYLLIMIAFMLTFHVKKYDAFRIYMVGSGIWGF